MYDEEDLELLLLKAETMTWVLVDYLRTESQESTL